jgi:hypothetical protein
MRRIRLLKVQLPGTNAWINIDYGLRGCRGVVAIADKAIISAIGLIHPLPGSSAKRQNYAYGDIHRINVRTDLLSVKC